MRKKLIRNEFRLNNDKFRVFEVQSRTEITSSLVLESNCDLFILLDGPVGVDSVVLSPTVYFSELSNKLNLN